MPARARPALETMATELGREATTWSPATRWITAAGAAMVVLLLALPSSALAAPAFTPTNPTPNPSSVVRSHTVRFAHTMTVVYLVSNRTSALVDLYHPNYTNELVLYNASRNFPSVLQKYVPGGYNVSLVSMVSAGGAFLLGWENYSRGLETFSRVTLGGNISSFPLILNPYLMWSFAFGNRSSIFATAAGNRLVELDATNGSVIANYSGLLPPGVYVTSVLPVGPSVYLAGTRSVSSGGSNAWFGYLTSSTRTVTSITKANPHPASLQAGFFSLFAFGSYVYIGGGLSVFSTGPTVFQSVGGLLFRYAPASGSLQNLSWRLPIRAAPVFAFEPWHATIALSLSRYVVSSSGQFNLTGGLFTLSSGGTSWVNRTSVLPAAYAAYAFGVTAESSGWLFSGGFDTSTRVGEIVALRI